MRIVRRLDRGCGAAALIGFLLVTARLNPQPGDVTRKVPERERLTTLIRVEQQRSARLRASADELRTQVQSFERPTGLGGDASGVPGLENARLVMGLVSVSGPGLVVTLDDSSLRESPSGNLNDLVIHSQDVQAAANGLWSAGAEALAVSGQRVVPTSAILCVGNTLLINGTVHSPPYRFLAVGRDLKDEFLSNSLVQRLADDADRFDLGFEVEERESVTVPAYRGAATVRFAQSAPR